MNITLIKSPDLEGTIDHLPDNHQYQAILAHRHTGLIVKAFAITCEQTCNWLMAMDGEVFQAFYFFEVAPSKYQSQRIVDKSISAKKLAQLLNRKASFGFGGAA